MIKDVKITQPITKEKIKEGFYVTVKFMYGDADGYHSETYGPFSQKEKESLIDFLNLLEKCLVAFPHGKGGFESYFDKVDELKIWADEDFDLYSVTTISEEKKKIIERIGFEWEYCPDGYGCEASIEGYEVKYYNSLDRVWYRVHLQKGM